MINAYRINLASTHKDSLSIARDLINAQVQADSDGADIIMSMPGAVLEIATAARMNSADLQGGLAHLYRAASLAGVGKTAAITAYHRFLLSHHTARNTAVAAAEAADDRAAYDAAADHALID